MSVEALIADSGSVGRCEPMQPSSTRQTTATPLTTDPPSTGTTSAAPGGNQSEGQPQPPTDPVKRARPKIDRIVVRIGASYPCLQSQRRC
jgi:hypothetical protein